MRDGKWKLAILVDELCCKSYTVVLGRLKHRISPPHERLLNALIQAHCTPGLEPLFLQVVLRDLELLADISLVYIFSIHLNR